MRALLAVLALVSASAWAQVPIYTRQPFSTASAFGPVIASSFTCGDGTTATCAINSNLSGATDPSITFGNDSITASSAVTAPAFRATTNGVSGGFLATISAQNPVGYVRNTTAGGMSFYGGGQATPSDTNADCGLRANMLICVSTLLFGWSGTNITQSLDIAFARNAAGVVEVNTGVAGTLAALSAANVNSGRFNATVSTATPTVGACGTTPSIASGRDSAFQLVVGSGGVATSCAANFSATWTNPPTCNAMNNTDRAPYNIATTATTVTITAGTPFTAGSRFHVICFGQ